MIDTFGDAAAASMMNTMAAMEKTEAERMLGDETATAIGATSIDLPSMGVAAGVG